MASEPSRARDVGNRMSYVSRRVIVIGMRFWYGCHPEPSGEGSQSSRQRGPSTGKIANPRCARNDNPLMQTPPYIFRVTNPPSIGTLLPVMNEAASEQRKSA